MVELEENGVLLWKTLPSAWSQGGIRARIAQRVVASTFGLSLLIAGIPLAAAHHIALQSGPFAGIVKVIVPVPDAPKHLYAGVYGRGIFVSRDGGQVWISSNHGLTSLSVRDLILDPYDARTLYVATDMGVLRSRDGATTWVAANTGMEGRSIRDLLPNPDVQNTLYAATDAGVFFTQDAGASWHVLGRTALPDVRGLARMDPAAATIYAGTFTGVFSLPNGAKDWLPMNEGLDALKVRSLLGLAKEHILLAGTTAGPFQWDGTQRRWTRIRLVDSALPVLSLAATEGHEPVLFIGTTHGLFRSRDRGQTWEMLDQDHLTYSITALASGVADPRHLRVAVGAVILESRDAGRSWDNRLRWVIHPDLPYAEAAKQLGESSPERREP